MTLKHTKSKMEWPILYRKNKSGSIQFWRIWVRFKKDHAFIVRRFGQYGTKNPQVTSDKIKQGKSIGLICETTAHQQACKEAEAQWTRRKKSGYVETKEDALEGKLDKLIKGGILPMLCHKYVDRKGKLKFPVWVQPKLDGHRCIAIIRNGICTLWTRTRKQYLCAPHIIGILESKYPDENVILDGELYNHEYKDNFEEISKLVRCQYAPKGHEKIQYHVYDVIESGRYESRKLYLNNLFNRIWFNETIKLVETIRAKSHKDVIRLYRAFRKQGYEGSIVRTSTGEYVHTRSNDLLKYKGKWQDKEFKVVGIKEGRGKLRGHVGAFWCVDNNGQRFRAKMDGAHSQLKKYFDNPKLWKGKMLTIKFQGYTGKNKVPRFPIALRFRED